MPELLPGKTPPKSVFSAEREVVAQLDAAGPDPEIETDDGDEDIALVSSDGADAVIGSTAPAAAKPAAAAPVDQPVAQPAAAAAPAVDPATPDIWAETEDVEYVDEDDGSTYIVRAPKSQAEKVKNGYLRRSFADRRLSSFGKNKAWVQPLIDNGSFDRLAPHLQRIFSDPDLQNGMAELLNRKSAGLPLRFADQVSQEIRQQTQQQAAAPAASAEIDENALREELRGQGYDDYTISASISAAKRAASYSEARYKTLEDRLNGYEQQRTQEQTAAQQRQAADQQLRFVGQTATDALKSWYPNELNDQTPKETWARIEAYARNSGLIDQMGFTVGAFTTAYMRMRETGLGVANPAYTAAPSTAVSAVAAVEAQARQVAAAAANTVAAAHAPTNGAATAAPSLRKAELKVPRFRKLKNGTTIPLTPTERAKWIADNTSRASASA